MSDEGDDKFKSRVSDVFAGLDSVSFKTDSSLKQAPYKKEDDFRRPPPPPPPSGDVSSNHRRRSNREEEDDATRRGEKLTDGFKKAESIFHESQDVGGWRQRGGGRHDRRHEGRTGGQPSSGGGRRPKNPMYDRRRPQHKDPNKYTKYSLADVSDVTDRSNTQAALAFLSQQRKRASSEDEPDEKATAADAGKPVFKKPKKPSDQKETSSSSNSSLGASSGNSGGHSKRILPEAVVGQTKAKKATTKLAGTSQSESKAKRSNKLSHLTFQDEEDED